MCKDEVKCCRKRTPRDESVPDESIVQIAVNGSSAVVAKGSELAGGLNTPPKLPSDTGGQLTGGTNVAVVCELQLPVHDRISGKSEGTQAPTMIHGQQSATLPSDRSASQISSGSSSHLINPDMTTSASMGTASIPTAEPFKSSAEEVHITISSGEENVHSQGDNQKDEEDDDLPVWRLSPQALQRLRNSDKTLQLAIKRLSRDLEQIRGEEMNALLEGASTQDN